MTHTQTHTQTQNKSKSNHTTSHSESQTNHTTTVNKHSNTTKHIIQPTRSHNNAHTAFEDIQNITREHTQAKHITYSKPCNTTLHITNKTHKYIKTHTDTSTFAETQITQQHTIYHKHITRTDLQTHAQIIKTKANDKPYNITPYHTQSTQTEHTRTNKQNNQKHTILWHTASHNQTTQTH